MKDLIYESIKRELNKRLMFECRCDTRLKAKVEGSTRLTYTKTKIQSLRVQDLDQVSFECTGDEKQGQRELRRED